MTVRRGQPYIASVPVTAGDMPGRELHRIRIAAGFSTRELAAIVGVTAGAITRWESSNRPIPVSMVRYLRMLHANGWKHEIVRPCAERASA